MEQKVDQIEYSSKALLWWVSLTKKTKVKYCGYYYDCPLSIAEIKNNVTGENINELYMFFKDEEK